MKLSLTTTISGIMIAAATATAPSASSLWRLTRRRSPSYSSAGIWFVFQQRPHPSHVQRSP